MIFYCKLLVVFLIISQAYCTNLEIYKPNKCVGDHTLTEPVGRIKFPNGSSESRHESNFECTWTIAANDTIFIVFNKILMKYVFRCHFEFIKITEEDGTTLAKICKQYLPPMISKTKLVKITFRTNSDNIFRRFDLVYQTTSLKNKCNYTLNDKNGSVFYPKGNIGNSSTKYKLSLECQWTIVYPNNKQILLTFDKDFAIPYQNYKCRQNYLEVREANSYFRGRFCGHKRPKIIRSKSNALIIKFGTSHLYLRTEFTFYYQSIEEPTFFNNKTEICIKKRNEILQLYCSGTGEPLPIMIWFKSQRGRKEFIDKGVITKSNETTLIVESILTISAENNSGVEGNYICEIESVVGHQGKYFIVKLAQDPRVILAIGLSSGGFLLVSLIVIIILYMKLIYNKRRFLEVLSDLEVNEFFEGTPNLLSSNSSSSSDSGYSDHMAYDQNYEISEEKISINKSEILGSGQHGEVYKGKLMTENNESNVAVKSTKDTKDKETLKALLSEIKIMQFIGCHFNIIKYLGSLTQNIKFGTLYIVVEFCELGSLESYLRNHRENYICEELPICSYDETYEDDENLINSKFEEKEAFIKITFLNLITWAYECANGMSYLESKKVIHSDLAARNLLLTAERNIKITDFGLSRKLYENVNYIKETKEALPWRWMAVESLKHKIFSSKSDIWSYGILLWEIFSLGSVPYTGQILNQEFLRNLDLGMRLERPKYATIELYNKMEECWIYFQEERPNFENLKEYFYTILEKEIYTEL